MTKALTDSLEHRRLDGFALGREREELGLTQREFADRGGRVNFCEPARIKDRVAIGVFFARLIIRGVRGAEILQYSRLLRPVCNRSIFFTKLEYKV